MANKRLLVDLDAGNAARVINLPAPVNASDVATKAYADSIFPNAVFGDGSDGDITISTGTTTLARDMFYNNLTINGTGKIDTVGFKIYVKGTLDLSAAPAGAIVSNGLNGGAGSASVTAGAGGARAFSNGSTINMSSTNGGGVGGTAAGTAGSAAGSSTNCTVGGHPAGGTGGAGSGGIGGAGSTATTLSNNLSPFRRFVNEFTFVSGGVFALSAIARNAAGGGGGGDGTAGGGGGGGGGMAGCIAIWANIIARGTNTTAAIIQAIGGVGGAGGSAIAGNRGGGGGGSGGTGGFVYICYALLTGTSITNAIDVSGGAGGNGGNGFGTGVGGVGGGRAGRGRVVAISLLTGTTTSVVEPDNGTAGGAASGVTGGTGTVALATRVSL